MDGMRRELLHYLELDAYLDDQGIPHEAASGIAPVGPRAGRMIVQVEV